MQNSVPKAHFPECSEQICLASSTFFTAHFQANSQVEAGMDGARHCAYGLQLAALSLPLQIQQRCLPDPPM